MTLSKTGPHRHGVHFYEDSASLCRMVARFLAEGLTTGDPAIVVATPPHQEQIVEQLRSRLIDVGSAQRSGALVFLDADETLGVCMVGGNPDPELFASYIGTVLGQVARIKPQSTVRAYGEMVDLLWKTGQTEAAVKLEILWNALASKYRFSLLCGYAMGHFYKEPDAYARVCSEHSDVWPNDGLRAGS